MADADNRKAGIGVAAILGGAVLGAVLGGLAWWIVLPDDAGPAPDPISLAGEPAAGETDASQEISGQGVDSAAGTPGGGTTDTATVGAGTAPAIADPESSDPANGARAETDTAQVGIADESPLATAMADGDSGTAEATADPEATDPAAAAPSFDTVRVEPDGSTLVAGRAAPRSNVAIIVDGQEIQIARADPSGRFAALFDMPPSDAPRVMTLGVTAPDGKKTISGQTVVVAPTGLPVDVAEAEAAGGADATAPAAAGTDVADAGSGAALREGDAPATAASEPTKAPDILLADPEGVRVLSPAPTKGVIIDSISYDEGGEVQLSGRGTAEGFARVYVNNRPVMTAEIAADGNWNAGLPEVDTGIYTLRVDQVDAEGKVMSRFETPFQRENPETLAAARNARDGVGENPLEAQAGIITVQPGFTLWAIASQNYGEGMLFVRVYEANRNQIGDPDLIYPGQVFEVPG